MGKQPRIVCLIAVLLTVFIGNSFAEIRDDKHITRGDDNVRIDIDSRTFNEVRGFFEQGYPASSVMLHGVTLGMSIDDVVYLAVKSDVERAEEIYDTAIDLLPSMPGWACRLGKAKSPRYGLGYDAKDLGPQPTLQAIADRYFNNDERIVPFPDWLNGQPHVNISTDELASLLKDQWWYKTNKQPNADFPIFVSLYKDNQEIIIDGNYASLINAAKQQGTDKLPVVVIYNEEQQRPISRYGDEPTINLVSSKFFSEGEELTPPPDWRYKDFHMIAKMDELKDLFEVPDKDTIGAARWAELTNDLKQNGFDRPMLITLLSNASRMWINEPDRVAAAADLGMTDVPVVFFNHTFGRLACGETASCEDLICEAAIAAGADASVCGAPEAGRQSATTTPPPPGGGGGNPSPN